MNKPANKNGFERCRVAFERLKAGEPLHPAHKGQAPYKVTPAVVSVEAGFDPGYLKKSRAIHASLIDEINRFRRANKPDSSVNLTRLNKALKKLEEKESEILSLTNLMQRVVAQNLQLADRVRLLELELKGYRNVTKHPHG